MTQPSVSEEIIRALKQIRELNMSGADENGNRWANSDLIDQEVTAALSLAHLPAGSEAVKPVAWLVENVSDGRFLTEDEGLAIFWAERGAPVAPLYAAPPSTPPAANVQEGELATALLEAAERAEEMQDWHAGHEDSDCEPHWDFQKKAEQDAKLFRAAATRLRSKQAPTVAATERNATQDQIAAVMLQHGTPEQQREALSYVGIARAEQREAPSAVVGEWKPIAEADREVATIQTFGDVTMRNSYPVWVRDADGRTYEAVWSDHKGGYWWDLDGESPVDPVEFMPHPLAAAPTSDGR